MKREALYSSDDVLRVLNQNTDGYVHSVFKNSLNGRFGDRLVHIGDANNGLVPFGIGLAESDIRELLRAVRTNMTAYWQKDDRSLIFGRADEVISLDEVKMLDPFFSRYTVEPIILKRNMRTVITKLMEEGWQCGFEEKFGDCMEAIFSFSPWMQTHPVLQQIDNLKHDLVGSQNMDKETLFDFWIGRGKGLTPSGDDFLVGVVGMLTATATLPEAFKTGLSEYIRKKGEKRTTQVSLEYFRYTLQQKFSSHVKNACLALLKEEETAVDNAATELIKIGHTSGADTLLGILLGCQCALIMRG